MHQRAQRELHLAKRMSRLGTETAFEVLVKARALEAKGRDIVHLEIGEPDFDTPANIISAGADAMHKGFTHYGPAAGLPQLREAIAQYVGKTRDVEVSPRAGDHSDMRLFDRISPSRDGEKATGHNHIPTAKATGRTDHGGAAQHQPPEPGL